MLYIVIYLLCNCNKLERVVENINRIGSLKINHFLKAVFCDMTGGIQPAAHRDKLLLGAPTCSSIACIPSTGFAFSPVLQRVDITVWHSDRGRKPSI